MQLSGGRETNATNINFMIDNSCIGCMIDSSCVGHN